MSDNPRPETVDAKQFAQLLNVSVTTLLRRAKQRRIPAPLPRNSGGGAHGRRGGRYLWRRTDVDHFLRGKHQQPEQPVAPSFHMVKEALREVLREERIIAR